MSEVAALPQHSAERLRLSEKTQITSWERLRLDLSERRRSLLISRVSGAGKAKPYRTVLRQSRTASLTTLMLCVSLCCFACKQGVRRSGIPAEAQSVLDTSLEDIDAGRYEKLYHEAADEWRNETTLDESKATFQKLREKVGGVRTRNLQSAREEQTATAHSVVTVYQTSFERGDGMETFTLLERGGHWRLARYYVTSSALK
jgi:hypothetical protein